MRFGQKETRNSNNALCIFRNGTSSIIKKKQCKTLVYLSWIIIKIIPLSSKLTVKTKSLKLCEYFTFYIYPAHMQKYAMFFVDFSDCTHFYTTFAYH